MIKPFPPHNHFASDQHMPVAMDPQVMPHYQALGQAQLPQQQMNTAPQRQVVGGQQQNQVPVQQKSPQILQQYQNPYADYDPQLVLFTFEKPKTAKNWEDVEPEQQHVAVQDLQSELAKFRRNKGSVKRALSEITSANCRRRINELVEEQNKELWNFNRSLQYRIASVEVEWRSINRRERMLKRVQVILETEPSGFQEPPLFFGSPISNSFPIAPEPVKPVKPQPTAQNLQFPVQPVNHTQSLGQQLRMLPQTQGHHVAQMKHMEQQPLRVPPPPHLAQVQHLEQQPLRVPPPVSTQAQNNIPPPPPPPPHASQMQGQVTKVPPPPPPPKHQPTLEDFKPKGVMPGTFPGTITVPVSGLKKGRNSPYGNRSSSFSNNKKMKHQGVYDSSSSSSDSERESESDSDSEYSSSNAIHMSPVDYAQYRASSRRARGRSEHSSKSRKSQRLRSQSKTRSLGRSRSQSRHAKAMEPYNPKFTRRCRDSESFDRPLSGKYSSVPSSQLSSPRSSRPEIPPIHIHMNTNNNNNDDVRDRHTSITSSPGNYYKHKRVTEKMDIAEPMSREDSWDRGSGTASYGTSSAYTAEDLVFDAPVRRVSLSHGSHGHTRAKSYSSQPQNTYHNVRPSHMYDEIERRPIIKHVLQDNTTAHYPSPTTHRPPLPHRRNSVQVPHSSTSGNPFASTHYPPQPLRSMSYATTDDLLDHHHHHHHQQQHHAPAYSFPPRRALTDHAEQAEERVDLKDLEDAIEHIKESRRGAPPPLLKRRSAVVGNEGGGRGGGGGMRSSAIFDGDEWDFRYPAPHHVSAPMPVPGHIPRRSTYSEY